MAWANLLGATDVPGAAATQEPASQSCHGHAQGPDEPATAPDSMPCCDGGGCYCAAPALTLPMVPETRRLPHLNVFGPFDTSALPANPLDDSLRPPIR
jgi:hypothetical protein